MLLIAWKWQHVWGRATTKQMPGELKHGKTAHAANKTTILRAVPLQYEVEYSCELPTIENLWLAVWQNWAGVLATRWHSSVKIFTLLTSQLTQWIDTMENVLIHLVLPQPAWTQEALKMWVRQFEQSRFLFFYCNRVDVISGVLVVWYFIWF